MTQRPAPAILEEFAPFVVVGSSKSGTTWLQKMLDAHPEVRCHFQLPILPLRKPSLFHNMPVVFKQEGSPYSGVFTEDGGEQIYSATLQYINGLNVLDRDYVEAICQKAGKGRLQVESLHRRLQRVVIEALLCDCEDKILFGTKAYTDLQSLFELYPASKVIHIIRDGRDVCVSKRFHTIRKGIRYSGDEKIRLLYYANRWRSTLRMIRFLRRRLGWFGENWFVEPGRDVPLFTTESLTKMATDWRRIVEYILGFSGLYPERFLTVKYEELLENGPATVKRILAFLNVHSDTETAGSLLDATRFDKLKTGDRASFFRKGQSGDWRNHFRSRDEKLFAKLTGDLLERLGYNPA